MVIPIETRLFSTDPSSWERQDVLGRVPSTAMTRHEFRSALGNVTLLSQDAEVPLWICREMGEEVSSLAESLEILALRL